MGDHLHPCRKRAWSQFVGKRPGVRASKSLALATEKGTGCRICPSESHPKRPLRPFIIHQYLFPNYLAAARTLLRQPPPGDGLRRDPALARGRRPLHADVHEGRRAAARRSSARSRTRRSIPSSASGPSRTSTKPSGSTSWPANLAVKTMALDPSKGADSRRGDYSAFVMLGVDRQGILYVEADLARRPTPDIVADGVELVPPPPARRLRHRGQPIPRPARRRVRARVPPPRHLGRPTHTHRKPHAETSPHPPPRPVLIPHRLRFKSNSPSTKLLIEQLKNSPSPTTTTAPTPSKWPSASPKNSSPTAPSTTTSAAASPSDKTTSPRRTPYSILHTLYSVLGTRYLVFPPPALDNRPNLPQTIQA